MKDEKQTQDGLFQTALKRSVKDIKQVRATAITDNAEMSYRRMVEDLIQKRKTLLMEREEMLDMSPESAISLVLAKNFDGRKFADKDIEIAVQIRLLSIQIELGQERYKEPFGGTV